MLDEERATPGNPPARVGLRRSAWIWPFAPPPGVVRDIAALVQRLETFAGRGWALIVWAGLLGGLPLLVDYFTGWQVNRLISGLLLTPLLLIAVRRDSWGLGAATVGTAFLCHSVLAIELSHVDPDGVARIFPDGIAYWEKSREWIVTGSSPEYELSWWLPAHFQLLVAVVLLSYVSFGFVTLWQGLYEVDLMNCYVGRLLTQSTDSQLALFAGWHVWSVCRGIGFFFVTFAVVRHSYERFLGIAGPSGLRRRAPWVLGLGFLTLDGVLKYSLLDVVRRALADNLR